MSATWDARRMRLQTFVRPSATDATQDANEWLAAHPDARLWDVRPALAMDGHLVLFTLTLMVDMPQGAAAVPA